MRSKTIPDEVIDFAEQWITDTKQFSIGMLIDAIIVKFNLDHKYDSLRYNVVKYITDPMMEQKKIERVRKGHFYCLK